MKTLENKLKKFLLPTLLFGLIGGCLMICVTFLTNNGPVQILPYPVVMISAFYFLKRKKSDLTFMDSFWIGVIVFMEMSIILFIYIFSLEHSFDFPNSGDMAGLLFSLLMAIVFAVASSSLLSVIAFRPWKGTSRKI